MFTTLFLSIIRCVAIPIVAFLALQSAFGAQSAFLVVTIALTVTNILSIFFQLFKIIPNLVLLKGGKIVRIVMSIIIEVLSIVGFWIYYLTNYN